MLFNRESSFRNHTLFTCLRWSFISQTEVGDGNSGPLSLLPSSKRWEESKTLKIKSHLCFLILWLNLSLCVSGPLYLQRSCTLVCLFRTCWVSNCSCLFHVVFTANFNFVISKYSKDNGAINHQVLRNNTNKSWSSRLTLFICHRKDKNMVSGQLCLKSYQYLHALIVIDHFWIKKRQDDNYFYYLVPLLKRKINKRKGKNIKLQLHKTERY